MSPFPERFKSLVGDIVNAELNETEIQLYAIEGDAYVDHLFLKNEVYQQAPPGSGSTYGLSPEMINVAKYTIEFASVILALFKIYLDYRSFKKESKKADLDEIKVKAQIFESLKSEKLDEELSKVISEKYARHVLKLLSDE